MTFRTIATLVGLLALPLSCLSVPAKAATAHNSQAGAYGPTSDNTAKTHRHFRKATTNR